MFIHFLMMPNRDLPDNAYKISHCVYMYTENFK